MTQTSTTTYDQAYAAWQRDPEGWWAAIAEGITWDRRWDQVFDRSLGPYGQWFAGGSSTPATIASTATSPPGAARSRR